MSRLFALVAPSPVDLNISLAEAPRRFRELGQNNPDGFGLGWFRDGAAEVKKHALPPRDEIPAAEAAIEAHSGLFIAHVRRSSRAPRAVKNTHPFAAEGWLFAHTGAFYPLLEAKVRREVGRVPYEGQTDSEAFFRLLLRHLGQAPPAKAIAAAVRPLIADGQFSGLNFVLASPGALYAFRYAMRSAAYYSLFWRHHLPGAPLEARSTDNFAIARSNALAQTPAVIVCSEELGGGEWQALKMGELLTIQSGPQLQTEITRLV